MPGMKARFVLSLLLLPSIGAFGATQATVTVYRCIDAKGHVSLQDDPCPKTSTQNARSMLRPQDPPPRPVTSASAARREPDPPAPPVYEPLYIPPPPLYQCTSYDGVVRDSEVYDPNPHCEPLALYYPNAQYLTPEQASLCRWVQDSCVRLSDAAVCTKFKQKKREAASAVLQAFSDTEAYRKSELARITQIIDESCR